MFRTLSPTPRLSSALCAAFQAALSALLFFSAAPVTAQSLRYLGRQMVPHGHEFAGTTVGGLSGLDCTPSGAPCVAISDDRSERQPARFYTIEFDLDRFNTLDRPGFDGVRFVSSTTLVTEAGEAHAPGTVDPEAIRHAPDGGFWWASEGAIRRGIAPAIERIETDGRTRFRIDLPAHFLPGPGRGARDNLAFESLAVDGDRLIVGLENTLTQDGPAADLDTPSPARLAIFDAQEGRLVAEHVYVVDAVDMAPPLPGLYRTNGLVELLAGHGMLLALERSYVAGRGNGAKIYRVELDGASDVAGLESLAGVDYTPVKKSLVLDLATLGLPLDNLEGMAWGPRLPDGRPTLILVSDDNFNPFQQTQFLLFEFTGSAR